MPVSLSLPQPTPTYHGIYTCIANNLLDGSGNWFLEANYQSAVDKTSYDAGTFVYCPNTASPIELPYQTGPLHAADLDAAVLAMSPSPLPSGTQVDDAATGTSTSTTTGVQLALTQDDSSVPSFHVLSQVEYETGVVEYLQYVSYLSQADYEADPAGNQVPCAQTASLMTCGVEGDIFIVDDANAWVVQTGNPLAGGTVV
jgi:hypothetical protein